MLTFAVFIPALHGEFLSWDDERNFVANPHFRGLGGTQLRWMWSTFLLGHYIPVSWMTLGLDYVTWGMNPMGYHLTNILLHSASAVLVYFVAGQLFRLCDLRGPDGRPADARFAGAVAALLYSLHPLRVESVAWITERRDVLSGALVLAAVLLYLRAVDGPRFRPVSYWCAVAAFVAAVLSKAAVVTLPAVLLILNLYPLRRWRLQSPGDARGRRVFLEVIPFAIPAAAAMIISVVAVHPPFLEAFGLSFLAPEQLADLAANVSAQNQFGIPGKLAVSSFSLCFYLLKTVIPVGLSPLYEMPQRIDLAAPPFVASFIGVVALAAVCMRWRRWPAVATTLAVFVIVSLPMLGVVQNGPQIAADRYTYHSAPALAILAAGALYVGLGPTRRYIAVIGPVLAALAILTWRQSHYWRSSELLWQRVLAVEPGSALGNSAMASVRFKQGRVDEGMVYSERALARAPDFAEARNDYAVGLTRRGLVDDALREYRRALQLKPRFDDAENNLGVLMMQLGQPDSAIAHYRKAIEINPSNPDAEINWGNALVRLGRESEALAHYERAVWIKPTSADAYHNWGVALARQGRFVDAATRFRMALAIDPGHTEAQEYLKQATRLLQERRP